MSGCGGHGHGGGHDGHGHGGGCSHGGHDEVPADMGIAYSLYTRIDTMNVECLNESVDGAGKLVFKPWEERLNLDKFVESDADEELLFNIPFTDNIKLKGIVVIGGENGFHPSKMRVFKNRPHMTFDDTGVKAEQEFELHPDPSGTLEYGTKIVTFSSVTHLTLHFPSNFGEDTTKIYYIGFRGEYTKAHRHGVTICQYETSPQFMDHKDKVMDSVGNPIM
ncbi:PITH domain-containing protein GA19395 [Oratosquilla oratoria]|uniref:PITH domain-containing protein GA19395 n=1 Tax=Oratosquilla oratoria TaxID=337810 RepID=UPI003F759B88